MNSLILAALGALALVLAGCTTSSPVFTTDYDASFSEAERAEIAAGFAEWPATSSHDINVVRVVGSDARCPGATEGTRPGSSWDGHAAGHTICFYVDDIAEHHSDIRQIAAHEYGHVLGVRFDGDQHYLGSQPSLMTPTTAGQASTPQAVDLAALSAVPS